MERKTTWTRDDLLALTPDQYLAEGFRDTAGNARPELNGICATASAVQLQAHQVAPQEMRITYEAWKQVIDQHKGAPQERARLALSEALEMARAVMNQPNNPDLVNWLMECIAQLRDEKDLPPLLDHLLATTKQSAVFLALNGAGR